MSHYDNLSLEIDARRGDNLVPRAFNDWNKLTAPKEVLNHNNPREWYSTLADVWNVAITGEERVGNQYRKLHVTSDNVPDTTTVLFRSDRVPVEPNTTYYLPRVVLSGTGGDTFIVKVRTGSSTPYERDTSLTPYDIGANTFTTSSNQDNVWVEVWCQNHTPTTVDFYLNISGFIEATPTDHNGWNTDGSTYYIRDWSSTSVDTDYKLFTDDSSSGYVESDAHACAAGQYAFGGAVGLSEQEGIVWYDSDMSELSVSRFDMETGSPQVAPANTAYAALRLYHTGSDSIGPTFFLIGDTSAEVEQPQDVYNDWVNPAYGPLEAPYAITPDGSAVWQPAPYGWYVPDDYTSKRTDWHRGLYFSGMRGRDDWFVATEMPVVPNTYTTVTMEVLHDDSHDYDKNATIDLEDAAEVHIDLKYFDKDGNEVTTTSTPSGNTTYEVYANTGWKTLGITSLTPENAETAVWYHRPRGPGDTTPTTNTGDSEYRPWPSYLLRKIVFASNLYLDDAVEVRDNYFPPQHDWLDVLADATEINFEREGIVSGFMNAAIKGDDFDPAKVDYVRPGRAIRVVAEDTILYQGTVTDAKTRYGSQTVVTVNASTIAEKLSNLTDYRSVAKLEDLSLILEDSGIPWRKVDFPQPYEGSTLYDIPRPSIAATSNGSSLADQIDLTRLSDFGVVWIASNNVLHVGRIDTVDTANQGVVEWTIDEDDYSEIEIGFDTESVVNEVTVLYQDYDSGTGTTTEVEYGPYKDHQSIAEWGVMPAELPHLQITFDATGIEEFAYEFLDINRWPAIQATGVRIPIRDTSTDKYSIDVSHLVRVKREGKVDSIQRVKRVVHDITPYSWTLELELIRGSAVQQVTY